MILGAKWPPSRVVSGKHNEKRVGQSISFVFSNNSVLDLKYLIQRIRYLSLLSEIHTINVAEHKWIFDMFNFINKTNSPPILKGYGHPARSARTSYCPDTLTGVSDSDTYYFLSWGLVRNFCLWTDSDQIFREASGHRVLHATPQGKSVWWVFSWFWLTIW